MNSEAFSALPQRDRVETLVNYTVLDQIEVLPLTSTADLRANGNGLNNVLTGNDGDNRILARRR